MRYQDAQGKEIFLGERDVMLTRKMAKLLQVGVGDMLQLRISGDDEIKTLRVTRLYRNPGTQGIAMSRKLFEGLEYDFQPQKLLTNVSLPKEITEERSVKSVMSSEQQWADMLITMEAMTTIVYLLGTAAVILGLVVLYNLSELSFVERIREYATLKALGMGEQVIRKMIALQSFIIGGMGVLLGIPLGKALLELMLYSMGDQSDMRGVIMEKSYLTAMAVTFGVVGISCFLMSFRTKRINMVDALKGVE